MVTDLIYFFIFIFPFLFFPKLYDPFELPKAVGLIFFGSVIIGFHVWGILTRRIRKVKFYRMFYLLLAFLVIETIASLLGGRFGKSFWGQPYRYQGLLTEFCFLGLMFVLVQIKIDFEKIYRLMGISGVINAALVILQAVAFFLLKRPIYTYYGRMTAFLGNPNFTAGFLVLSFIVGRFYSWPLATLSFVAILLTGSRGGILAFLLALSLIWKKKALLFAFLLAGWLFFPQRLISPFEDRLIIWQKAAVAFSQKPILGWGKENFELAFKSALGPHDFDLKNIRVDKAHNEILEIAVGSGLVGLTIWLFLVGKTMLELWRKRNQNFYRTNLVALLVFLVLSQFNVLNLNEYLFFYLVIASATFWQNSSPPGPEG